MLSQADFDRHKQRFASGEFDPGLYRLLDRLVRTVVFGLRLSPALAPGGVWNDAAAEDALQGWVEKRLLVGGLQAAFDRASAPRPFINTLEQSFRHYLQNERERSETGNVLRRTRKLLREEPEFREWLPANRGREAWWGLAETVDPQPYGGSDENLVRLAWQTGEYTLLRFGPAVDRHDPVLKSEDLKRFLEALFTVVGALLTMTHLTVALERRFDLGGVREVQLEAEREIDVAARDGDLEIDEEELEAAALAALAELSERQAEILFRRFRGAKLAAIAEALRISISTADNEVKRASRIAEAHASDNAPAARVVEKMVDLLS